jgi:hypothetical protein
MRRNHPDHISHPIIDIQISAAANVVRFEETPEAHVKFLDEAVDKTTVDKPEVEAGSADERVNIPEQIEPGITYHDVRVRWHAAAKIADQQDDS